MPSLRFHRLSALVLISALLLQSSQEAVLAQTATVSQRRGPPNLFNHQAVVGALREAFHPAGDRLSALQVRLHRFRPGYGTFVGGYYAVTLLAFTLRYALGVHVPEVLLYGLGLGAVQMAARSVSGYSLFRIR